MQSHHVRMCARGFLNSCFETSNNPSAYKMLWRNVALCMRVGVLQSDPEMAYSIKATRSAQTRCSPDLKSTGPGEQTRTCSMRRSNGRLCTTEHNVTPPSISALRLQRVRSPSGCTMHHAARVHTRSLSLPTYRSMGALPRNAQRPSLIGCTRSPRQLSTGLASTRKR